MNAPHEALLEQQTVTFRLNGAEVGAAPGETIDGLASWTLGIDDAYFIQSSGGISWRTIGRRRTQTVSTAAPSGGKDGDLWYQV